MHERNIPVQELRLKTGRGRMGRILRYYYCADFFFRSMISNQGGDIPINNINST